MVRESKWRCGKEEIGGGAEEMEEEEEC